jgi:DNA-binding LacI/PurR family transcriptional regulator
MTASSAAHGLSIDKASPIPIYRQLTQAIRAQILTGEVTPGDKLPSEADLAREIGVSPMTVRQAYTELANAGVLQRSHGRGTFVLPPASDVQVRTSTDILLLSTNYSAQAYSVHLNDALAQGCDTLGWNLHFSSHRARGLDHQANAVLAALLRGGQVDAVLATGPLLDRDVEQLAAWQVPVILLDHEFLGGGVRFLRFDDEAFVRLSVARLAATGCRRIGLIPGPLAEANSRFRRRADRMLATMPEACAAAGVPWLPELARPCASDEDAATVAAAALMAHREPPDALILHGDSAALGARRVLAACAATVSLATFADDPSVPGSVISKPFAALAHAALDTVRRIRAQDGSVPMSQIVPISESR